MKSIAALLLTVVVAACSSGHAHHDLLSKAEQLVDLYPDSALRILSAINIDSLTTEDERAHYGLLQAEASHGAGIPLASDSLISYSLFYYERQGNQRLGSQGSSIFIFLRNLHNDYTDEWMKKMWYIYTMKYYSVIKKERNL